MSRLSISVLLALTLIGSITALADDPTKPSPPVGIPDDPPPHEGAMIDFPMTIEPPDLIIVELLEALPGRPITGERLVRPDGTITLGFYGDVHVRGLTTREAKVKIILHMRKYLNDHVLGLMLGGSPEVEGEPEELAKPEPIPNRNPFDTMPAEPNPSGIHPEVAPPVEEMPEAKPSEKPVVVPPPTMTSRGQPSKIVQGRKARRAQARAQRLADRAGMEQDMKPPVPTIQPPPPHSSELNDRPPAPIIPPPVTNDRSGVPPNHPLAEHFRKIPLTGSENGNVSGFVEPADSDRVLVDFVAYNSKTYFVLGDVHTPGRLPFTGKETVLDALNYAGGFVPTAEPTDIHLYRPARGNKPAKDYRINIEAIYKGDKTANLQMFPDDRLIVGRNPIVKKTVELDRANALINSQLNTMLQYGFTARTLGSINNPIQSGNTGDQIRVNGQNIPVGPLTMSPTQRDAMIKDWAEFLWSISSKEGGAMLDEKAFKDAWIKKLTPAPESK